MATTIIIKYLGTGDTKLGWDVSSLVKPDLFLNTMQCTLGQKWSFILF